MSKPFVTYLLLCADGSYYAGHTDDLDTRLDQHDRTETFAYTAERKPFALVWTAEFETRAEALEMELRIKKWSRRKKAALVAGDLTVLSSAAKKRDWQGYRERRAGRTNRCTVPRYAPFGRYSGRTGISARCPRSSRVPFPVCPQQLFSIPPR